MTVPALRSNQGPTLSSLTTTHSIGLPATVSAGDLLVVFVVSNNSMGLATWAGAGWSVFLANTGYEYGLYKVATGTEGGTSVTLTTGNSVSLDYVSLALYNTAGVSPQISGPTGGVSVSPDPAALTPSWGAADAMWIAVARSTTANFSASPAGYANLPYQNGTTPKAAVALRTTVNAVTEDPGTFTISSSQNWSAYTIGIKGYTPPTGNNALFFGGGF